MQFIYYLDKMPPIEEEEERGLIDFRALWRFNSIWNE